MKKLFLLSFILFSFFARADYWTQKANFGGTQRQAAIGFSIAGAGFIATGRDVSIYKNDVWQYDPAANTWSQKANVGLAGRHAAIAFTINNKGYLGTGYNSAYLNDFWEYDLTSNSWTQKADVGGIGRFAAVGFSLNGKGYVGAGYVGTTFLKDFWEYDPLLNTWTQKTDVGGLGRLSPIGFSDGSKGYVGIGTDSVFYPNGKTDFWEWDPATNVWTQKASFAGSGRTEAFAFYLCPFGYVGTGTTHIATGSVSDFWKYDIANNIWVPVTGFGAGLREMAASFVIGNKGYVGTGFINDNINTYKDDFWEYTPDSACATGLDEFEVSGLKFEVAPNPAKDFIVICYSLSAKENIDITITDVQGKKVYQSKLLTSDFRLPTSNFKKGIYFVELVTLSSGEGRGGAKAVKKFVKE